MRFISRCKTSQKFSKPPKQRMLHSSMEPGTFWGTSGEEPAAAKMSLGYLFSQGGLHDVGAAAVACQQASSAAR